MQAIKLTVVAILLSGLLGCASGARMEGMSFYGEAKNLPSALRRNITITEVIGGADTNPAWAAEIDSGQFTGALIESLRAQTLYSGSGIFELKVEMIEVAQPTSGPDITVTTKIRYTMKNSTGNLTVFDETIVTSHTTAIKNRRQAYEGSAKKNIERLLEKVSQLSI